MTRLRSTVAHHVRRIHHQERSPSSWNGKEHTSDKNEDAITSMVFTPLRFMAPGEALKCLRAVVPSIAEVALARGSPIDQNVTLCPPGLKARDERTRGKRELNQTLWPNSHSQLPGVERQNSSLLGR